MSINNTPNIGPYTELKPFRFWCQKVLPLVYDESLSYYELLCKVVDYLNKTMEDVDQVVSDMGDFKAAYDELITYVNNYFVNLDVTTEINNKLDAMAEDGTLTLLIKPFFDNAIEEIPSLVTDWLDDHVMQEVGYVIDKSLKIEDAAADSKAVGDILLNVTEATENLNNQGMARKYANGSGVILDSTTNYIGFYDKIACEAEESYSITVFDAGTTGLRFYMCFYDASNNLIGSQDNRYRAGTKPTYTYTSPQDAAYMFFNCYDGSGVSANAKIMLVKSVTPATVYNPPFNAIDLTARANITKLLNEAVRLQSYVSTDLNDFKNIGFYFTGWNESLLNSPTADDGTRIIITFGIPSTSVYGQLHYNYNTKDVYFRVYLAGSWQAWKLLNEKTILYNESLESKNTDDTYTTSASLNHGNKNGRVKILSYNVAHWNNDSAVYISNEKVINVKKLLMAIDADAVCLQEDAGYIDSGNSKDTLANIFAPLYCYKLGTGANTIYDKKSDSFQNYNLTDSEENPLITIRRTCITVDSKTLYVYNCHLDVASATKRADQLDAILSDIIAVENPTYWVIVGDFNTLTATDVTKLESVTSDNNATLANGGFLGWLSSNKNNVAIDNMICSENVLIREYHILENWFTSLYSDHYPTYAVLELL